jgi:hypothetical protein
MGLLRASGSRLLVLLVTALWVLGAVACERHVGPADGGVADLARVEARAEAAPPCPPPQLMCGGQCIDPSTSRAHCGASGDCLGAHAGKVCSASATCVAKVCRGTPVQIGAAEGYYGCVPELAADPNGNVMAVWRENSSAFARRYSAATGAWGKIMPLDDRSAVSPVLALDPGGNATVVWTRDWPRLSLWAKRHDAAAGTWSPVQSVGVKADRGHDVAVDDRGNATAVWMGSDGRRTKLWANRYGVAAGSWGGATAVDIGATTGAIQGVAADGMGNVTAIWGVAGVAGKSGEHIWASRYDATTKAWTTTELTDGESVWGVVADATGNVVVVSEQRRSIWARRFSATAGVWQAATQISPLHARFARVAMARSGNAVAVWEQAGSMPGIWANHYNEKAGRWGVAAPVAAVGSQDTAFLPRVAVDAVGNATAVWLQPTPLNATGNDYRSQIWASRYSVASGTWGARFRVDSDGVDSMENLYLRVVMDHRGTATVIWRRRKPKTSGCGVLWANRLE